MSPETLFDFIPRDFSSMFAMFWHAIIFEVPRVLIAAVVVGGVAVFRSRQAADVEGPLQQRPKVSLLLAGHNEGGCLDQAIAGLREQTYDNVEIIVIDDGSSDDMAARGNRLLAQGHVDVFLSTGLRGGKSAAANLGLAYCTGEIVMIADIDTSFDRDAIAQIVRPFDDPRVGGVSGNLAVRNPGESLTARFQAIQYLMSISLGRRFSDMLDILFIASGAFAAFRREALASVGGWEVGPGEDADLTVKLRRAGWKIRFQGDAWALTDVPVTPVALFRQRMRWNRSFVRVRMRKFRAIFDPRPAGFSWSNALGHLDIFVFQGLLPLSFYFYMVWLFATYGAAAVLILGVVSMAYVLASLMGFLISAAVNHRDGTFRLLIYVPGYALFNAYCLRAATIYAYLDELFLRNSYRDSYVPTRVLNAAERF